MQGCPVQAQRKKAQVKLKEAGTRKDGDDRIWIRHRIESKFRRSPIMVTIRS